GSARSVAALLGGSTQFATGSATGPLAAAAKGSDIKILAASYNKFPYDFVVKPEIRTPKELRGKKVNILNFGGSNDLALQLALKEWGMKLNDVQVIVGGDAPGLADGGTHGRDDSLAAASDSRSESRLPGAGRHGRHERKFSAIDPEREGKLHQRESRRGEALSTRLCRGDSRDQDPARAH